MYECGKLEKVIGNKILFRVILEQCELPWVRIVHVEIGWWSTKEQKFVNIVIE